MLLTVMVSVGAAAFPIQQVAAQDGIAPLALASACTGCHGPSGVSPGSIPPINQLDAATFVARMRAFKEGQGEPTVMSRIAKGFADREIEALAQAFVKAR